MAEKITLKNTLANLPQKTDVDSIVARDASGNPVYIKTADLAQVVAELIPVAGVSIKGLTDNIIRISSERTWHKIFEKDSNQYDCVMLGTMFTYANQDAVVLFINARKYESSEPELIVKKIISARIVKPYGPEISYKIEESKLTIWAKGYTCLLLSSNVNNIEPYIDTPPEDAIGVDLNL